MSVDQDNGAMLQEYLMKEHKYKSENRRDGSSLLPEAMRAKTRVPRWGTNQNRPSYVLCFFQFDNISLMYNF